MKRFAIAGMFTTVLAATTVLFAQEVWTPPAATEHHLWLKQFIGEWESEAEMQMAPDQPADKAKGREKVRGLGDMWIISDFEADMPGGLGKMTAVMTVGYDPEKGKYIGTWVDSMTSFMWKYEGTVDETGKILTLNSVGPNMMTGVGTANYRDITEFKSPDHRVLTAQAEGPDGTWVTYMTAHYHKK